jgi:hypothetical protein
MQEARIELLQRMPVFGGIRADILQFLVSMCPVVSVPANGFFFMNMTRPIRCSYWKPAGSLC